MGLKSFKTVTSTKFHLGLYPFWNMFRVYTSIYSSDDSSDSSFPHEKDQIHTLQFGQGWNLAGWVSLLLYVYQTTIQYFRYR